MMEILKTEVTQKYGIADKDGNLLHIHSSPNGNADFCNDNTVSFTTDEEDPLFLVDSVEAASFALVVDLPWYNSGEGAPMHAGLDLSKHKVVAVEQTLTITAVSFPTVLAPDIIAVWDIRKKNRQVGCVVASLDKNGDRISLKVGDGIVRSYQVEPITQVFTFDDLEDFDCPKFLMDQKRNNPSLIYFAVKPQLNPRKL